LLKRVLKSVLRRVYLLGRRAGPPAQTHPHLVQGLGWAEVSARARLAVEDAASGVRIRLGRGVFIADGVQLTAASGGAITLGDDTTLQQDCLLGGDVQVGAHCLFGKYVFVSSTTHRFRDHPAWLIRDQDRAIHRDPAGGVTPRSRRVVIEDDCWIGQGVVVNPGITIGRGAIIGANSIVTKDMPPYAVSGGVPARLLGTRLDFSPPAALNPQDDGHLPYFYRGFRLTQERLAASRARGLILADGPACLVLAQGKRLRLAGHSLEAQKFAVSLNGSSASAEVQGDFDLAFDIPSSKDENILSSYSVIEIAADTAWGLSAAEIAP
jgi:acetyltransferase-like isoleucine patch superfamily enzyme